MNRTLTALDRLAIHEVLARYAWALDTGDEEAFVACFVPDAEIVWDVFEEPGVWRGHAALGRFIAYFRGRPESAGRQHHVSNVVIEPTAHGARASAYVLVALHEAGAPRVNVMGYYEDELAPWDDGWRLVRRIIRDWSGPVLRRIAGQDGQRQARQRPGALDGLWATQQPPER